MGVPKFYKWLSERYPLINQIISSGTLLPEIDNFYLDMNGIIHGCTHPHEDILSNQLSMKDMILGIFRYIDRIVSDIVRPKKVLFLAIDGVAPRAKLNQQRARRFRAAEERTESISRAKESGQLVDESELFDSNCITPGTEFMDEVGRCIVWFIRKKVKEDPLWQSLDIVFSGHDVPGEGEHKIMDFLRELRQSSDYDPNTRHCMYGQDADLIMLGLSSHEPHFTLLREVVQFTSGKQGKSAGNRQTVLRQTRDAQFQLLHLSVLREYISLDLGRFLGWKIDIERILDDFIFMTFLVGNDFLPHLPTLAIAEQAFDVIIECYRQILQEYPPNQGYLVQDGRIVTDRIAAATNSTETASSLSPPFARLLELIGSQEESILAKREQDMKEFYAGKSRGSGRSHHERNNNRQQQEQQPQRSNNNVSLTLTEPKLVDEEEEIDLEEDNEFLQAEKAKQLAFEEALVEALLQESSLGRDSTPFAALSTHSTSSVTSSTKDNVKQSSSKDYRRRYYFEKFHVIADTQSGNESLEKVFQSYVEGLGWCLAYYQRGCISWSWYYPFHYGPLLGDLTAQRLEQYFRSSSILSKLSLLYI